MPYYGQWGGPAEYAQQQQAQKQQMFQNLLRMMMMAKQTQEERAIREREWQYKVQQDAYERQMAGEKLGLEKRGVDLTAQGQADLKKYREGSLALEKEQIAGIEKRHLDNMLREDERIRQAQEHIGLARDTNFRLLAQIDADKAKQYRTAYNDLIKGYQQKLAEFRKAYDDNWAEIKKSGATIAPGAEEGYTQQRQQAMMELWYNFQSVSEALADEYGVPRGAVPTQPMAQTERERVAAGMVRTAMGPFGGRAGTAAPSSTAQSGGVPTVRRGDVPPGTVTRKEKAGEIALIGGSWKLIVD